MSHEITGYSRGISKRRVACVVRPTWITYGVAKKRKTIRIRIGENSRFQRQRVGPIKVWVQGLCMWLLFRNENVGEEIRASARRRNLCPFGAR